MFLHTPDITVTIFGYASATAGQTVLAERRVTANELVDGQFEAELDALARENGWQVTHLCRRTPEYQETLKLAAEFGMRKAVGPTRTLLERYLTGEVTESLLFALGRAVREGGGHPVAEYALQAAERDVYSVYWRVRLGPSVYTVLDAAETWAGMALDWIRPQSAHGEQPANIHAL